MKFSPTPRDLNTFQIKNDLREFGRKLKCRAHFDQHVNLGEEGELPQFKQKSKWIPDDVDPILDVYLSNLEERVLSIKADKRNYSNLSKEENLALKNLRSYKDIIIKEADKGSAVVVWGKSDYCKEAYRQLLDKDVYEEVENFSFEEVNCSINKLLNSLQSRGLISKRNAEYLFVRKPRLGRFYLLPKIHKRLENVPGRPVISNCGTATERISEFLDFCIQPMVQFVPSVIKDTTQFLKKLQNVGYIPETAIMCTIDVVGLYPHIPHGENLNSLRKMFAYAGCIIPQDDLIKMAKLVLENNYFEFNEKVFRQKLGTAIGTKFAPAYANIFMGFLEIEMIGRCEYRPWIWWRFLDDVFMVWLHGGDKLDVFLSNLNSFHEQIKFTWEISASALPYLDVMVSIEDGMFVSNIYRKPTDTQQYLNMKSCHPPHVKKSIPYSQALRIKRICDSDQSFERESKQLKSVLEKRGYSRNLVENQIERVRRLKRSDLLEDGSRSSRLDSQQQITLVIDYHPALLDVYKILRDLQILVEYSAVLKKVLPIVPLLSFRRAKNLKDYLVRAKLTPVKETIKGMNCCGGKRCQICKFVKVGSVFESSVEGRKFHINHSFDCNSTGVVYLFTCQICKKQYVGSTITSFRARFNNHRSSLSRYGKGQRGICGQNLYAHFYSQGHNGLEDIQIQIIDVTDVSQPTIREGFWVEKINCYEPKGLNVIEL